MNKINQRKSRKTYSSSAFTLPDNFSQLSDENSTLLKHKVETQ